MRISVVFATVLCILVVVFIISSCFIAQKKNNQTSGECKVQMTDIDYLDNPEQFIIEMHISPHTVSREGLYLNLVNNADEHYNYCYFFELYVRSDDDWARVPIDAEFDTIALVLFPNSYSTMYKNLYHAFGELPCGVYKITKRVFLSDSHPNDGFDVFATFVLRGGEGCTCW